MPAIVECSGGKEEGYRRHGQRAPQWHQRNAVGVKAPRNPKAEHREARKGAPEPLNTTGSCGKIAAPDSERTRRDLPEGGRPPVSRGWQKPRYGNCNGPCQTDLRLVLPKPPDGSARYPP